MGEFDQTVDLPSMTFKKLNIGPHSNNVYVLTCKETKECVIIDTSQSAQPILALCEGAKPKYILQTHCHGDHIDALEEVRKLTGAPMGQHPEDAREFGTRPDFEINDGDDIPFGKISLKAIHTPGHCRGMLMFLYPGHCVCGDTIFPGGPGKTWNHEQLVQSIESIKNKVLTLPGETVLYPGHGANSTVADSQKEVAAFEAAGRPKTGEFGDITWAG
jgi:glyoxylase-like metal-dependent hydrolase (beta-lactamase superfamily II)